MKRNVIGIVPLAVMLTLGLATLACAQEQGAAAATQRDANQQKRIEQGSQSGELSTKEAGKLEREEQAVERDQARAMKSGGKLTPQEKARIEREQNAVSRDVARQKHDAQTGNPNSVSSKRMQADVQRNANQQQRIANGVKSGELTNKEAGHLEAGQARVNGAEANAAANGHVGAAEQGNVQARENRQSGRVYKKKHNERERGGG